jgi:molybdopterin-guanine dinucleotide biosynthesis protein A
MGRPKVWLRFGNEHLLQRVVRIVGGVVRPVVACAQRDQSLPPLPDDILPAYDAVEDVGPLAGIAAGFEALADVCDAAFIVSCDHPMLKPAFVTRLIDLLADHPAVVVESGGRLHPLAGVYRLTTRATIAELIEQGDYRAHGFARACGAHIVTPDELNDVDPGLDSLLNVNDPEAYDRAVRKMGGGSDGVA